MLVETKAQNNTIFLSSHILADMDEICDRIAVLYDGEIRFVGTPKDFKKETGAKNLERAFLQYIEKDKAA
jgi:ABC-2 type transport system ATP-binding protein